MTDGLGVDDSGSRWVGGDGGGGSDGGWRVVVVGSGQLRWWLMVGGYFGHESDEWRHLGLNKKIDKNGTFHKLRNHYSLKRMNDNSIRIFVRYFWRTKHWNEHSYGIIIAFQPLIPTNQTDPKFSS